MQLLHSLAFELHKLHLSEAHKCVCTGGAMWLVHVQEEQCGWCMYRRGNVAGACTGGAQLTLSHLSGARSYFCSNHSKSCTLPLQAAAKRSVRPTCIHTCTHTNVCMYVRTYVHSYPYYPSTNTNSSLIHMLHSGGDALYNCTPYERFRVCCTPLQMVAMQCWSKAAEDDWQIQVSHHLYPKTDMQHY